MDNRVIKQTTEVFFNDLVDKTYESEKRLNFEYSEKLSNEIFDWIQDTYGIDDLEKISAFKNKVLENLEVKIQAINKFLES